MNFLDEIAWQLNGGWTGVIAGFVAYAIACVTAGFFFHLGWNIL